MAKDETPGAKTDRRKPVTLEDYRARVGRVLDHIAAAVRDGAVEIDLNALAEIACFSPYHFHRIYRSMTGETAAQTVRRLRLQRAAHALIETDRSVAEIARAGGYGGVEAFGRAFAAAYGLSPSTYRARGGAGPNPLPRPDLNQENAMTVQTQDVQLIERAGLRLAAVPHRGPFIEIGTAFERLSLWAAGAGLFGPDTLLVGVYYDDPQQTAQESLRSDAGLTIPEDYEPTAPAHLVALPGGPHAVLRYVGPYAELHRAYDYLYGRWLPESGREPADSPPFEIYRNTPADTPPAELTTDICAPLKPL